MASSHTIIKIISSSILKNVPVIVELVSRSAFNEDKTKHTLFHKPKDREREIT